jgi:hypothetical protein
MATFFGPLSKQSCLYFLILSMIFFTVLVFTLLADLYFIIKNYKAMNYKFVQGGTLIGFNLFIAYFVNRLMYTMCAKSLI